MIDPSVKDKEKLSKLPLPKLRSEEITQSVAKYIVQSILPVSTVEKPCFRELLATLEGRYNPPSKKTLLDRLKHQYDGIAKDIICKIRDCDVAITHDGWTSLNTECYETVTCSFIIDWELKCYVLETVKVEGSHTSDNIAGALTKTKKKWQFGNVCAVTDNASNEVKAFSLLSWPRLPCMGHNINLVVNAGLKEVSKLLAKGSSVVSYFHRSPLAMGLLFDKQKLLLPKESQGHKLITDCQTRWNSTVDMLERLTEQTPALHAVATDINFKNAGEVKNKLYTFAEQAIVESVVNILKPFKLATTLLSSETQVTLSLVLPSLVKLEQILEEKEDDLPTINRMKKTMRNNLAKRNTIVCFEYYSMASLLDPRTKSLGFLTPEQKADVRQRLIDDSVKKMILKKEKQVSEQEAPSTSTTQDDIEEPQPAFPRLSILGDVGMESVEETDSDKPDEDKDTMEIKMAGPSAKISKMEGSFWLDDVVCGKEEPSKYMPCEICEREVDRYLQEEHQISQGADPLKWWAGKECMYPNISQIAKFILSIPASSVPSERIFSLAGLIVSKKRTQLSPENVDLLIFLKKNS